MEEKDGKLENAIEEIELALGLFELHPENIAAREKYIHRLKDLKQKLAR
jgi:hypothetical protein